MGGKRQITKRGKRGERCVGRIDRTGKESVGGKRRGGKRGRGKRGKGGRRVKDSNQYPLVPLSFPSLPPPFPSLVIAPKITFPQGHLKGKK